jgi:glycosyltransferase involved in cell wall biosynthesis
MTHPELEKLLDELGIASAPKEAQPADSASPQAKGHMPLVVSIGEFTALENYILSAMWRRFDPSITSTCETSGISLIKYIADHSRPKAPVVVIIGRGTLLKGLLAIMISAKYNGRKVHVAVADPVLESLTRFGRIVFAHLISYADRVVCFSARELGHLKAGGVTADVLYPIVDSVVSQRVSHDAPQPRIVSCVCHGGGELSTLLKAFSLVKGKYPRAELTIFADPCEVVGAKVSGVTVKSLDGCMIGFGDSFDISVNLSSLSGGFLPFMMAQTAGLPSIVTDFGDIREMAINGDNAIICRLNDPVSLADAIIAVVEQDNLRDQLIQGAALCCNDYSFDSLREDWSRFLGLSV